MPLKTKAGKLLVKDGKLSQCCCEPGCTVCPHFAVEGLSVVFSGVTGCQDNVFVKSETVTIDLTGPFYPGPPPSAPAYLVGGTTVYGGSWSASQVDFDDATYSMSGDFAVTLYCEENPEDPATCDVIILATFRFGGPQNLSVDDVDYLWPERFGMAFRGAVTSESGVAPNLVFCYGPNEFTGMATGGSATLALP